MTLVMSVQAVLASPQVTHAAVDVVSATAINSWQRMHFQWHTSGWAAWYERLRNEYMPSFGATAQPRGWDGKGAPRYHLPAHRGVETQQEREEKIARIKVFPGDVEIKTGEQIVFNAVTFDADGNAVGGPEAKWSAHDEEKNERFSISSSGALVSDVPGKRRFIAWAISGRSKTDRQSKQAGKDSFASSFTRCFYAHECPSCLPNPG
jgi:hypothetical protein